MLRIEDPTGKGSGATDPNWLSAFDTRICCDVLFDFHAAIFLTRETFALPSCSVFDIVSGTNQLAPCLAIP